MAQDGTYIDKQFGSYRIIKELSRGSFGSVCLGKHTIFPTRPLVAIKILHAHLGSQQDRQRFLQEAQILEELKHPHILPIIDANIQDGFPYFIVDYAPKGSLRDRLQQQLPHPMPLAEALAILSQLAQALQYAHQHNIVHRDLKPANILFNANGDVLLADFGIATVLNTMGIKQTQAIGTPRYMAPEQFRGTVSRQTDQYALGCIAYELLTGRPPFLETDLYALLTKHSTEYPPPPTQLNSSLPKDIEPVLLQALLKDPTARFASVQDFATALEQASRPAPPIVQPLSPTEVAPLVPPTLPPTVVASSAMQPLSPTSEVNTPDRARHVPPVIKKEERKPPAVSSVHQLGEATVLFTYKGHSRLLSSVNAVVWSPDGRRIASASRDKTVQVWDAADGGHPFTYKGHSG